MKSREDREPKVSVTVRLSPEVVQRINNMIRLSNKVTGKKLTMTQVIEASVNLFLGLKKEFSASIKVEDAIDYIIRSKETISTLGMTDPRDVLKYLRERIGAPEGLW